jgi:aminoglycoside phosphotransferase
MPIRQPSHPIGPRVIEPLLSSGGETRTLLQEDMIAERCGRNEVWRIDAGHLGVYFAKRCSDHSDFQRQLFGLRVGMRLADENEGYLAAPVVYEDPETHVLVTKKIAGEQVSDVLKMAYRMDKNPWRQRDRWQTPRRAITSIVGWLSSLHQMEFDASLPLHDHTAGGIARRINDKLELEFDGKTYAEHLGLKERVCSQAVEGTAFLIFGDVSLSNFFFDGARIGAIDFEDLGVGSTSRDHAALRRRLEEAFRQPHYHSDPELLDLIPKGGSPTEVLFDLEIHLLRFESSIKSQSASDRLAARSEGRIIRNLLSRLA